ncbi:hypothetical protein V2P20_02020 [Methylobacter sp. Wu1]|uniref:hypothetical protein n=1 Tax=Methylobacter sp. Wu1 TaxID=3119359 RepID=UPI002F929C76
MKNIQNEIKVKFETPIGIGTGTWNGELPALGDCTDIEIDIDDNFEWGKNITTTNSNTSMIAIENNLFRFVARVISYEEDDGCLTVKLGDSVVFLNVDNVPSGIQGWVEGKTKAVRLYPTNL